MAVSALSTLRVHQICTLATIKVPDVLSHAVFDLFCMYIALFLNSNWIWAATYNWIQLLEGMSSRQNIVRS